MTRWTAVQHFVLLYSILYTDHPQPLQLSIADITRIGRILHTATLAMEDYIATSPSARDPLAVGVHIHTLETLIQQVNCLRLAVPYTSFVRWKLHCSHLRDTLEQIERSINQQGVEELSNQGTWDRAGKPRQTVDFELLLTMVRLGFKLKEIGMWLGVTERTVRRRLADADMTKRSFSPVSDIELCSVGLTFPN